MNQHKTLKYSRQIRLPEVGFEGQSRLSEARVLIVGVGGLGSPAALYLAASGVGCIGLVDDDTVDLSNLPRQVLYYESDVGTQKALRAAERLRAQFPDSTVLSYCEYLNAENIGHIIRDYDVVVDGSDNFSTKLLLNDAAYKFQKSLVVASVTGFEGRLMFCSPHGRPCYRCFMPTAPRSSIQNCAESGILSPVAGVLGTWQALEVIKWLTQQDQKSHLSHLLTIDFLSNTVSRLHIPYNPHCKTCSQSPSSVVFQAAQRPSCVRSENIVSIRNLSDLTKFTAHIDVREADEVHAFSIPGAVHLPLSKLKSLLHQTRLNKKSHYIVYCASGNRSQQAAQILRELGFHNVSEMEGGLMALDRN